MDRDSTDFRTTNLHPSGLDRPDHRAADHGQESTGDSSLRADGDSAALPGTVAGDASAPHFEEENASQKVTPHDIWFQLSLRERECFGHRFSGMVLKAFGQRATQEVQS
jgi:hypothetical protein